ncbi:hypothetical protein EYF80_015409 [Liparis tanakae]|uniref:Uncharacterized protein n=1 Tax=Liparis tanakae TaxID=230148 RepID=A0A4Z2I8H6_9TELE|nr:hypothetical protein EYF80_015409 [Liparis tanakae]
MSTAADEQNMSRGSSGTPDGTQVMEGMKERGIAQGDMALVWPVSRPPVLEHETEQVVYTPRLQSEDKGMQQKGMEERLPLREQKYYSSFPIFSFSFIV